MKQQNEPQIKVSNLCKKRIVNAVNDSFEDGREIELSDIRTITFYGNNIGIRLNDGVQIALYYDQI